MDNIVEESRAWARRVGAEDYKWHGADVLDGIYKVEDLCDHIEVQERRIEELREELQQFRDDERRRHDYEALGESVD